MANKFNFKKRLSSMLKVDFRRMFTSLRTFIILGICFIVPVLILVMVTLMEGSPMTDQNGNPMLDEFGNPVLMEGFKNVWQMLGSVSGQEVGMTMDITTMCNINMMFFAISALVCLFVSDDFRSGYSKNLFTVRSKKTDYVISKIVTGFVGGSLMIILFFIGSLIGAAISGVSFDLPDGVTLVNIIMSLFAKIFLSLVFISIFVTMSVACKKKTWLSILCSVGVSMLLFMMISVITPLNSEIIHVILCVVVGLLSSIGLGALSNVILKKSSLV